MLCLAVAFLVAGPIGPGLPAWAAEPVCRRVSHEGQGYSVCTADLRRHAVRLFWKAADGDPYGGFRRLVPEAGPNLLAAMNAGMYDPALAPVGLYVESGRELKPVNTAGGEGNFHLKPNGIFFVEKGRAGVAETGAYLRRRPRPDFATQSGPMLVIGGRIHPKISQDGPSKKLRNGVGVRDPRTIVFAISDGPVSFGAFARLFRDALGCRDALYLDGSVSSLYAPELGRRDGLLPLGPLVAIMNRPDQAAVTRP
ncbi:hypothetical protein HJG44_18190 [Enterovirga sp. DB1703]|uniref:Phosphodiester glycosidase domain-containing protein n=1 Tax=Enterovirga aerilata TaxID=2730920 RepID=A0A849I4D9_9HYPH|nr:hypothetical protein [Enterovirga sp. DB1703]